MSTVSYRYMRRKVARFIPETMLGKLTWYVGFIWFGIYLVRWALFPVSQNASHSLDGWAATFNFTFAVFLTIVTFRWVRRKLLWRVRNRLIVTYIFIGVIPVVLILGMVGISGYLISNQYATSQARVELEGEIRALDLASASHAASVLNLSGKKELFAGKDLSYLNERYPGLMIVAWRNGEPIRIANQDSATQATEKLGDAKPPTWLKESFHGVVIEDGKLYIRTLNTAKSGSNTAVVLASVPVTKQLLDKVIGELGAVAFYSTVRADHPAEKGGLRVSSDVKGADGQKTEYEFQNSATAAGGKVPAVSPNYWDPELNLYSLAPYRDWVSGEEMNVGLVIKTRLSALISRLFANTGAYFPAALAVLVTIASFFALIELVALFFGVGLTRTITSSVFNLYRATQHINRGDLKYRIPVKNTDQLASLQTAFNSMAENLEKLLEEQKIKERLENELAIAQEVQETLFPRGNVEVKSLELHGVCRPARTVSGDYYDFLPCGTEQLGIALGDISGKGISAALLMATIHSAVRAYEYGRMPQKEEFMHAGAAALAGAAQVSTGRDLSYNNGMMQAPAIVLELLNRHLFHSTQVEKYATLFLGVYDGNKRSLTYTNAGHLPPLVVQDDGTVQRLETGGMVIGLFDGMTYEQATVNLRTNDIFVAFSDGITEPENEFGEFGEERLIELIRDNRRLPLTKISELVIAAVQDWIGADTEQPDDVTLVLARVL
ncbi:MAG: serine phosphatase [Acidobacteriales bacterium]|nr:serine phosphatase [Terriglobales bacterium]